jgi:hypothetical protein
MTMENSFNFGKFGISERLFPPPPLQHGLLFGTDCSLKTRDKLYVNLERVACQCQIGIWVADRNNAIALPIERQLHMKLRARMKSK